MASTPKVSIGVPVYNGENFLAQTLDSLLQQTYQDYELIISDNASTDSTEQICRAYAAKDKRVKYHRYEVNKGAAWNFNNTFHLANGKYFKWAAHDDLHEPRFVERCVEVLENKPEVVLCFTRTTFIDDHDNEICEFKYPIDLYHSTWRERFRHFSNGGHVVHEIFGLIRADVLRDTPLIGGYLGSDLVLLGQLALSGPYYQVDEVLFHHREHQARSMINPQGAKNKTEWYDASKKGDFVMPYWRRFFENARGVLVHDALTFPQKIVALFDLLRVANWNRTQHLGEILTNGKRMLNISN